MAQSYKLVQWTPFKKVFDLWLALGVGVYLASFIIVSSLALPAGQHIAPIQLLMRAFGSAAFGLLTLILMIGPLARGSDRFKPMLYNRRHLGVTCFLLALIHAALTLLWYQGFATLNPFVALLVSNPRYDSIGGFPFESLGLAGLAWLFVLAATSHDFFNANLGPGLWKSLHMGVYFAFAAIVAHVMLGIVQYEKSDVFSVVVSGAVILVAGAHFIAAWRERGRSGVVAPHEGWLEVCALSAIEDKCAKIVSPPGGERIAVFRDGDKVWAISNVCRHQGGPLGEGRIIDGCVTCPWHGYQYRPQDGRSPAPFTERVETYRTRIEDGLVWVCATPEPLAPLEASHA